MDKLIIAILFLMVGFQASKAQSLKGDEWSEVQKNKSGTLVIAYYIEDGFSFQNSKGEHTGVQLDILAQFANYLKNAKGINLSIDFKPYSDFVQLYEDVRAGKGGVIGAANVTVTDERKKEIDFSPTYLTNISVLLTHPSVPDLGTNEEWRSAFNGFSGITQKGTTHEHYVRETLEWLNAAQKIRFVASNDECISEVAQNEKLFTYVDLGVYWLAKQQKKNVKHQRVGDKTSEQLAFILPKGSAWTPVIAEFFNLGSGYRANPAYRNILFKHLGSEVTSMLEMARLKQAN